MKLNKTKNRIAYPDMIACAVSFLEEKDVHNHFRSKPNMQFTLYILLSWKEIEEVCRAATEKGILIVAAYSNQQVEATYPASFPFVMGVRCLDIENPLQVLQYDGTGTDVIFSSKFFSLYHVGIPKFYQGNSFGCAVITGYLKSAWG